MEAQHEAVGEVTSNGNMRKAIKQAQNEPWVYTIIILIAVYYEAPK